MQAFLQLVAEGKVRPAALVTHRVPIGEAERAYQVVTGEVAEPYLGILLEYPSESTPVRRRVDLAAGAPRLADQRVHLGVIGGGAFARAVLLPELKKQADAVELRGLATATGPSAEQTGRRFSFAFAASDWAAVLEDEALDAVLIATCHDLHAEVAAAALRKGLHVFVEKPL